MQWLGENIYRNNQRTLEPPPWLGDKKVYLVDASDEPVHGSDKADYRLQYAVGLFDLVIGDRAYCSKQGIAYLRGLGSGFVLRFGTRRFHIYNANGREVNILRCFKGLKPGESGEATRYYEYEGEYQPLRFCVLRKTKEAERKGLEALEKTQMRKHGNKELSKAQRAYNRYVVVVTSISDAALDVIRELYRQRWQIELVFKRLKSLFGYHEIPVHIEQSALAWFYGKLLLAALCETWVNSET
ncbi:MAG: transposase [Treponema sp.]|nr:transposase [Treponema sp.]